MTPQDVRHYRFLERAIRIADKKIDSLREGTVIRDKVTGSNPEYPYEERSFNIGGDSPERVKLTMAIQERDRLVRIKAEIDDALIVITDPLDKVIFERTMQGQSQTQIAAYLNIDQGTVSRRLRKLCSYFD